MHQGAGIARRAMQFLQSVFLLKLALMKNTKHSVLLLLCLLLLPTCLLLLHLACLTALTV